MQQATRIILIRHGETDWNTQTRIQGHTDIGLNPHGRWQAQRLAAALADEGLSMVYTSDLQRARATAQAVADTSGVPLAVTPTLRERAFGTFEGRTFAEIESQWPEHARRWRRRDPSFCPPGGEALQDFFERSVQAVHTLAAQHQGQTVAMVAHGGVLDCLYRAATGQALDAPRTWAMANAGINRLLRAGDVLTLVGWADVGHLDDEPALDELNDGAGQRSGAPRGFSGG
ncbi:MAG: histidine phosphatase family protein [Betaproteobacteria bacterium]|nr:histidine phosphatase family protein [Betaproteobacteria bacterium]